MIRDGELKLGGSLIHSLQTFPDGTHGCPFRSSSVLSLWLIARKVSLPTRDTTLRHFCESVGSDLSDNDRRESLVSLFAPERTDLVYLGNDHMFDGRSFAIPNAHARSRTGKWTVILARTCNAPSGTCVYACTHTRNDALKYVLG